MIAQGLPRFLISLPEIPEAVFDFAHAAGPFPFHINALFQDFNEILRFLLPAAGNDGKKAVTLIIKHNRPRNNTLCHLFKPFLLFTDFLFRKFLIQKAHSQPVPLIRHGNPVILRLHIPISPGRRQKKPLHPAASHRIVLSPLHEFLPEPVQKPLHLLQIDRLGQIIRRPVTDSLLCIGKFAETAENHGLCFRIHTVHYLKHIQSRLFRHTDVKEDYVHRMAFQESQAFIHTISGARHLKAMSLPFYELGKPPAHNFLIVYN